MVIAVVDGGGAVMAQCGGADPPGWVARWPRADYFRLRSTPAGTMPNPRQGWRAWDCNGRRSAPRDRTWWSYPSATATVDPQTTVVRAQKPAGRVAPRRGAG